MFNEGAAALGGAQDIDAWVAYFRAAEPSGIAVPPLNRIVAPQRREASRLGTFVGGYREPTSEANTTTLST